ncbi:MAG: S8 family serine peptidase [Kiritimatiellae bacterium]|nr:S8 family serine peptidase [Kiritimatiellia bacterium]
MKLKYHNLISLFPLFMSLFFFLPPVQGSEVFLKGGAISIQAEQEDLRDVLQAIAEFGVRVEIDPQINQTVTLDVRETDVEEAIAELVHPLGYALVWTMTNDTARLDALRVFRIGQEVEVRPLAVNRNLNVVRGWNGTDFVADELLLTLAPGTTLDAFQLLLSQLGATVIEAHPGLGIYRLRFPPGTNIEALVAQLINNTLIRHVEPNYAYRMPTGEYAPLSSTLPSGLREVNAPASTGNSLAILDSGLTLLPELQQAVVGAYDSFDPQGEISDPAGHGTQMALIASGAVVPDGGVSSSEAIPLIAIRAFDSNGYTSTAELLRAMDYALDHSARVINLSWGTETDSELLRRISAYAQARGAIVVASAGNEATGKPVYPAAYPGVLAIGAVNPDGGVWEKSNYGEFLDLAAPGGAVFPVGYNGPAGPYMGTSAAAAYTSKTIASYFTRYPDATPQQALDALAEAVTDAGEPGKDAHYGVGVLDAQATQRYLQ